MTLATNRSDKKLGGEDEDEDVTSGGTLTPGEEARDGDSSKSGTKVSEGQDGEDEDKDEVTDAEESGAGCTCCPVRYCIIALMCIGMVLINAMRTNVGFTVMTILDETAHEKVGTLQALINVSNISNY